MLTKDSKSLVIKKLHGVLKKHPLPPSSNLSIIDPKEAITSMKSTPSYNLKTTINTDPFMLNDL